MGNQSSQCFALLYLDGIDRFIKEKLRVKFYLRYMDDMIILVRTKEEGKRLLEDVRLEIKKERLELNPKSAVIPVKNGVEFLGWKFKFGKNGKIIQKIRQSSRKRMLLKVRKNLFLAGQNRLEAEGIENSLASYKGHLLRGNGYKLYERIVEMVRKNDST